MRNLKMVIGACVLIFTGACDYYGRGYSNGYNYGRPTYSGYQTYNGYQNNGYSNGYYYYGRPAYYGYQR
jgi:hypothetical protein